jgi:poly-gamma-glutamate capsule biosynthesis protein CapA/YwtB (metallophosphatase superfamily)
MHKYWLPPAVLVLAALAWFLPQWTNPDPGLFVSSLWHEPRPVRVVFVGDLMLDRNVARSAYEGGVQSLFSTSTLELLGSADVRVANLEGTVTTNTSIAQRDHSILRFTFDPAVASSALALLGLDAVSLANNHTLDFGASGYAQTRGYLEQWGIPAFGHPLNDARYLSAAVTVDGRQLCFVGYHALFEPDRTEVLSAIRALRPTCWRIVVMPHWGEEYHTRSNGPQQAAAHELLDAGADLVVGAHPHVVQEVEVYRGKAIFYSLGNFMFDQNFSWATMHGLAVVAELGESSTYFRLIPLTVAGQYSSVAEGPDRQKVLDLAGVPGGEGQVAEFSLP